MDIQNNETRETTVYWRPEETVTLKGTELAALLHLVDLQTVSINQIPLATLMEMFSAANLAKADIMKRLEQEGKLSTTPPSEKVEEEPTEISSEEQETINSFEILEDTTSISQEIL